MEICSLQPEFIMNVQLTSISISGFLISGRQFILNVQLTSIHISGFLIRGLQFILNVFLTSIPISGFLIRELCITSLLHCNLTRLLSLDFTNRFSSINTNRTNVLLLLFCKCLVVQYKNNLYNKLFVNTKIRSSVLPNQQNKPVKHLKKCIKQHAH